MEASQAGGQAATNGDGQGEGQGQGPDVAALAEQLGANTASVEELRGFIQSQQELLQSQPWAAQQGEGEGEPEGYDLSFLDPSEPGFDPETAAQQFGALVQQAAQDQAKQMLQEQIDPLRNDMTEMRHEREVRDLVAECPELADPEVAKKVAGEGGLADQMAQDLGMPALAQEPKFWRLAYFAGRAAEAANAEGGESPQAAHLEGGGGAAPAGGSQGNDFVQMLDDAAGGGRKAALPFH